jgi:hypothetical protein
MADVGSKGDTPEKATAKIAEDTIEAVIADAGVDKGEDDVATSQPAAEQKSKLGLFIIIVLFLIAASVGGLKLTGQLQPMYESLQAQLGLFQTDQANPALSQANRPEANHSQLNQSQTDLSQTIPSQPHQPQMKVGSSARMPVQKTSLPAEKPQSEAVAKRVQSVQSEAQPVVPVSGTGVTSAEVSALLVVIDQLRTEMQQLEASQQTLHDGLLEQQQMNTQVRLRWIADPASRLPQMQLAWEEISLLPGLTRDQRELAVEMHALARSDVQRVVSWKANLQRWVEALATPVHADVLPQPQQPWLAWIIGQFQLRQAPSAEARHLMDLRGRLQAAARQLSLESWPTQGAWQSLHAELLLQIKAMQGAGDTVETGLPLDFSSIQHDISTLRRAAQQWSAADQQGDL